MNGLQKAILTIGGIILLANLVFPPWESHTFFVRSNQKMEMVNPADRQFIGNPPVGQDNLPLKSTTTYKIHWSLLGVTSLAIVMGTGLLFGLTVLFKDAKVIRDLKRLGKWLE